MELSLYTLILLPVALGLLGFIEPCTIGGHLLFLETQRGRGFSEKLRAVGVFIVARALVTGLFGGVIAWLGSALIGVQTGLWLVFGSLYLAIGLLFIFGRAGLVKQRLELAPAQWRKASNPIILGLAFGLNIPACAAPILFGLLGLAATSGTAVTGFIMMAMPFYVVQASQSGFDLRRITLLLGAQTAGALVSNFLWGWWGDRLGKASLLKAIAFVRILPPLAVIIVISGGWQNSLLGFYLTLFFITGALANGLTIAVIGFLMEISPNDKRPTYSGYFNAITAPAFLLPLLAGILASVFGLTLVFGLSMAAAVAQFVILRRVWG